MQQAPHVSVQVVHITFLDDDPYEDKTTCGDEKLLLVRAFFLHAVSKILFVQVCQFSNATCGTFQALTQHGYMSVSVQNIGTLAADYQLQVITVYQHLLEKKRTFCC